MNDYKEMKIVKNIRIKYPITIDNNTNEVFHFSIFNINVQGFHHHKLILQVFQKKYTK